MARLDVNKRLGRHDEAAAKSAEQQFDELKRTVAQLDTATKGSELNATVASETKLIDSYQSAFRRAVSLDTEQTTTGERRHAAGRRCHAGGSRQGEGQQFRRPGRD